MSFEITSFLEDNGIAYDWYDETNVTFDCPWCEKGKRHFSVSADPDHPVYHCFKCGSRGDYVKLVSKLLKISLSQAEDIVHGPLKFDCSVPKPKKQKTELKLPADTGWVQGARDYLEQRGITDWMIKQYGLYFTMIPPFAWRIVIPIFYENEVVAFQARSIFEENPLRYKNPSEIEIRDYVYGYDRIDCDRPLIVVEGPFDRMIMASRGENVVAIFGKDISENQRNMIVESGVKRLHLMFDSDATGDALGLSYSLAPYFDSVSIVPLSIGDPAESRVQISETNDKFMILDAMVKDMTAKLDKRLGLGLY